MNVAIIGNSHFGRILQKQLSKYDKANKYIFYDTNSKKIDKLKFMINIFNTDIVYSVSASISGGGALNLATLFNKKIIQHFLGSDVINATDDFKNARINKKLISESKYLCEVDWIKKELEAININAEIVPIMAYKQHEEPKEFTDFNILTYMGKGKEEFYGIEDFIELAKNFSDVTFKIAGIENYANLPNNIKCLGWIDMIEELQNATVFIRNAKHDGLGFSVVEALSLGRVVLRNYPFAFVNYFKNRAELINKIKRLKKSFDKGELGINFKAIEFVKEEFDEKNVINNLKETLLNCGVEK